MQVVLVFLAEAIYKETFNMILYVKVGGKWYSS